MTLQRDKQTLVRIVQKHGGEWLSEPIPVMTGTRAGVVSTGNGKIWVRFDNGQEVEVLNGLAPIRKDIHVRIGHLRSSPGIWRVAEVRQTYIDPIDNDVPPHHEQHEYDDIAPGFDITWTHRKQIISATAFVSDAANFKVRAFAGLFPVPGGWAFAPKTGTVAVPDPDLTSYIPAEGACYVNIEVNTSGAYVIHKETSLVVESRELLDFSKVPVVPAGSRLIAFVMLFESMPSLLNEYIYLPGLFMTDYAVVDTGYQINTAPADTPLDADKFGFWDVVDEVLKSITLANFKTLLKMFFDGFYAALGHTHAVTTRWEPLANGDPSDPQIVFDGEGDVIMVEVEI